MILGLPVKLALADDFFDRRRYEITNGLSARNSVSDVGRGNVEMAADRGEWMFGFQTGPIEHDELDHFRKLAEAMPGREAGDVVLANEVNESRGWLASSQEFDGVNGVRRRGALELQGIEAETRLALDRGPHHFDASVRGGRSLFEFVRRQLSGNEEQLVELELFDGITRQNQMAVMNRIECAAEDADLFQ